MTEHVFKNIYGFFDFEDLYSLVVKRSLENSHFVEVGSLCGCSAAYMSVEILNSGKNIKFDCIDTWDWEVPADREWHEFSRNIYECFLYNVKKYNLNVNPIKMSSCEASLLYAPTSLDFVFLDADHSYKSVCEDIFCWMGKVKPGGIIAGHDYGERNFPGVAHAVNEIFGKNAVRLFGRRKTSWAIYV